MKSNTMLCQYNTIQLCLNKKGKKKPESKKEIRGGGGGWGESNLSTWKKITLAGTEE